MPTINENFLKLEKNYLFINIAKKVNAFMAENPDAPLIRMGIGDVTLPIAFNQSKKALTKWELKRHSVVMRTAVPVMIS